MPGPSSYGVGGRTRAVSRTGAGSGDPASPQDYTPRTLKLELNRCKRLRVDDCLCIGVALASTLTRQPKKVFHVPGAPLEIRWAWGQNRPFAFTATALGSKLWLCYEDPNGEWQAKEVATIGGEGGVLPVDISLSADDRTLFVSCFGDGKVRVFNVSNPHQPHLIYEETIGQQVSMVSQSWDGKRLYFSSSLLGCWDKKNEDNEQFVKGFTWNGRKLKPKFALDFTALKL